MNVSTPGSLWMIDQPDTLTGAQQPLSRFLCSVAYLDLFRVGIWHIPAAKERSDAGTAQSLGLGLPIALGLSLFSSRIILIYDG